MMLLASDVYGSSHAGIPMVNRLVVDAARRRRLDGVVISLDDQPNAPWLAEWPGSFGAGCSKWRFARAALARASHAEGSVILATHCGLVPVGRLVKIKSGGRLVLFLHGVEVWRTLPPRVRWGVRGCDLVVANSQFTLDEFRRLNPDLAVVPAEVCHLPARLLTHEPASTSATRPDAPHGVRAVVVGRLWGRGLLKGQRTLISIWSRVVKRFPNAELIVVGEGDGQPELEQLAGDLGVGSHVRFTGFVADAELDRIYRSADMYVMPSKGEGFGLVFAEAMSYGLPCIASRYDAGREVVVDGVTGLLVDPDDDESVLQAVTALIHSSDLRGRMGAAGRERARTMFGLERFDAHIQSILNGGARGACVPA